VGTFNAGAIEARLTLDRTPWNRDLQAARAQARRFRDMEINPEAHLDLHLDEATAKIELLMADIERLDGRNVTLDVDVDGFAELAALEAMVDGLDGRNIELDIDVDGGAGGGAAMATARFTRFEAIVTGILILLPLVAPVAASATAAIVGLTAGLVGAGGALGILGIGLAPTIGGMMELREEIGKQQLRLEGLTEGTKEYNKQQERINNLQKEFNERFGPAASALNAVTGAWASFQKAIAPEAMLIIASALGTVATLIPMMTPIFEAATPVITDMFASITAFAKGPEGERMLTFFREFGVSALGQILAIGGNILQFFGRLFEAFAPFGTTFLGSIEDVTQAWADWADGLGRTEGFKNFIDYVMQEGPRVWDLIKNIIGAFINFGIALAPLGEVSLDVFNAIFSFIANMDPTILGAIAVAIGGAVTGMLLLTAATAAFNAVAAMNPIALIIILIGALVAAIIYLWNNNETFRNAIIAVWEAIKTGIGAVVDWFTGTVVPMFQTAWAAISSFFAAAWVQISPIVTGINDIMILMAQIVTEVWQRVWSVVQPILNMWWEVAKFVFEGIAIIVTTVMNHIATVISVGFGIIKAIFLPALRLMGAIWSGTWGVIRAVFITVINVIRGVLGTFLALIQGNIQGAMASARATFYSALYGILSIFRAVFDAVRGTVRAGTEFVTALWSAMMSGGQRIIREGLNQIKGMFTGLKKNVTDALSGAGDWLINAGESIIRGLAQGIRNVGDVPKQALGAVLGGLRRLLPSSPAAEGPFSGRGWTPYSGMAIVEGLASGIRSRASMAKASMLDVMEGLSGTATPDIALGVAGTGTLAGSAGSGGATGGYDGGTGALAAAIAALAAKVDGMVDSRRAVALRIGDREFVAYMEEIVDDAQDGTASTLKTGRKR
jgi:phage-related protein